MIAKSAVPIDFSAFSQSGAIITAIDNFLSSPSWGPLEMSRPYTLNWSDHGGTTVAKQRALHALLNCYRDFAGWNVTITSTTDQTWVVVFGRRSE